MAVANLDPGILADAQALRRALHRRPELSGAEVATAKEIASRLEALAPTELLTGFGGTGVAAVFGAGARGLVLRCELDALPIVETGLPPWRSEHAGVAHLCGHDGHMAILFAVARVLAAAPPDVRVILLFQPAEETGHGARAVLEDNRFAGLRADMALSLHNMPGAPFGAVGLKAGPVNCASRGLQITLEGRTAHASEPAKGHSPGLALSRLIPELGALSRGAGPEDAGFRLATVTHARLGERTFGVAPGIAELCVTLRTLRDADMATLEDEARTLVAKVSEGFEQRVSVHEAFTHCENHPDAIAVLEEACAGRARADHLAPMRASEDFGLFGHHMPAAMVFLGAGEGVPPLHAPDYDFPDALIREGADIFLRAVRAFAR